jgi:hypothetical protein
LAEKKNKRGGAQLGAGRKPVLTPDQRFAVGELYARRWKAVSWDDAIDKKPLVQKLNAKREHLEIRAAACGKGRRELANEMDGLLNRVFGKRRPHYRISSVAPRAYGKSGRVADWVIAKVKKPGVISRDGIPLTRRMVEQCWKEYAAKEADKEAEVEELRKSLEGLV